MIRNTFEKKQIVCSKTILMKKNLYAVFFSALLCVVVHAQNIRLWSTYYGGSGNESGVAVATDRSGNIFLAGITSSLGMAFNGYQNTFGGGNVDAYLVKFDAAGNRLWATYYGGTGNEMPFFGGKLALATDSSGDVYLAGPTDSNTGIASPGGFQTTIGGGVDAYLVKFDSAGNRLWATYYGGSTVEYGYAVAVDAAQNVYLGGTTGSASGIASGGFQNTLNGSGDAFLVKFDAAGNRQWATYYGGPGGEVGFSIATDPANNVFLAGTTDSPSGISSGGFQNTYGGGSFDAFVAKFDAAGNRIFATYYGGAGDEMMTFDGDLEIATDASGNFYLAGMTSSTTSIASAGFQNTFGGGQADAFLAKFDYTGNRAWATYYGGTDEDKAYHAGVDTAGNIFLSGITISSSGISSAGYQTAFGGYKDAFLVKFNSVGYRLCATYYGGSDYDDCGGLAVDNAGNVYIGGGTANTTGISSGGFQTVFGGGNSDAFLVKFSSCTNPLGTPAIISENSIHIYPNPSAGKFIIANENVTEGNMEIFDGFGQLICTGDFNQQKEVDISFAAKGMYFVMINDGKRNYTKKILLGY
jgi:hypothetical protein